MYIHIFNRTFAPVKTEGTPVHNTLPTTNPYVHYIHLYTARPSIPTWVNELSMDG